MTSFIKPPYIHGKMITMNKRWLFFWFTLLMLLSPFHGQTMDISDIQTMDGYRVVNQNDPNDPLMVFDTYQAAYTYYQNQNDPDLLIIYQNQILTMDQGMVFLNASDCNTTIDLINTSNDESGYTNACYGIDGYYSHTNSNGTYFAIEYGGSEFWVSSSDATLIPLDYLSTTISKYRIINGNLVHFIKGSLWTDQYANTIELDQAPSYLSEDQDYYSADGHYFYSDINSLLDDLNQDSHDRSINKDSPYYNFYQYLSHRSLAKVDETTLNDYFNQYGMVETMDHYEDIGKDSISDDLSQSMLNGSANAFLSNQYRYGVNGLMMASLSLNESGTGRSHLAYTRNNLFGHAAYDSAVEANASRYLSIDNSIASHASNYIVDSYCDPSSFTYHGCFFGNKTSGMNVSYASDPYWGEKAASYLYDMDTKMHLDMKNQYKIGLFTPDHDVDVLIYTDSDDVAYSYKANTLHSVLISGESNGYYQIQLDHEVMDQWNNPVSVGYIPQSVVDTTMGNITNTDSLVNVTLDANGGSFNDGSTMLSYSMDMNYPSLVEPSKDQAIFNGYELVSSSNGEYYYQANYKNTVGLTMTSLPKTLYETNERFDCTGGKINLQYEDGTNESIDLTMDMITGYRADVIGNQRISVHYGGQTTSFMVTVSDELDQMYRTIQDTIQSTIDYGSATMEQINAFKQVMDDANTLPILSMDQYRALDAILVDVIHANGFTTHLDGDTNFSLSNLSMAVDFNTVKSVGWFENVLTVGLKTKDITNDGFINDSPLINGYINDGYTMEYTYDFSIRYNDDDLSLQAPLVITIPFDHIEGKAFKVIVIDGDHIYECPLSIGSTTLSFMSKHTGTLIVLSRPTTQSLMGTDPIEVITMENDDAPYTGIGTTTVRLVGFAILLILLILWITYILINIRSKKKRRRAHAKRSR